MSKRYVLGESAARRLAQMLRGKGEVSSRPGAAAGITVDSEYVAPFTVQWAQSVGDAGAWIIWLPSDKLVALPSGTVNPAASLTASGGDYPAGWYVLTDAMLDRDGGGTLYLNVTLGDSPSAVFSSSAAADSADEFDVPICSASVNSETGERRVKQLVVGAIALRGSGAADKGCWRIVAETVEAEGATCTIHYIDRQFFCVGGIIHEGEDKTTLESLVEAGTPFIAAKITTSGYDYSAAIVGFKNFAAMKHASLDRTFSLIPLYELQPQKNAGGEEKKEADSVPVVVVTDFRAMPLAQAFELPTLGGVV